MIDATMTINLSVTKCLKVQPEQMHDFNEVRYHRNENET